MGFFGSNENTAIDIGAGSIKVVRIERHGKRPKLLSVGLLEFPVEGAQGSISAGIRQLLAETKISRGDIITQMPGKDLTIRSFTLPKMPLVELKEAVRWEAKRHISFPIETAIIEHLVTGEKREGTTDKYEILMVAAERKTTLEYLAPFAEAKLKVSAVDANALALRNVFHLLEKPVDVNTVVVDIGAGKTEIDIFKGGILRFSRCLETGGLDMTRTVSEVLGIGFGEAEEKKRAMNVVTAPEDDQAAVAIRAALDALLMEIRRSVDYYKTTFREQRVESTRLTGGVSLMQGIKEYFVQSLEGAVELDAPFEGLSLKSNLLEEFGPIAPRFSAAVGLALRKG